MSIYLWKSGKQRLERELNAGCRAAAVLLSRGDLNDTSRDSAALFRLTIPRAASIGQVHEIGKRISKRPED